jgi:hypothetical protein
MSGATSVELLARDYDENGRLIGHMVVRHGDLDCGCNPEVASPHGERTLDWRYPARVRICRRKIVEQSFA